MLKSISKRNYTKSMFGMGSFGRKAPTMAKRRGRHILKKLNSKVMRMPSTIVALVMETLKDRALIVKWCGEENSYANIAVWSIRKFKRKVSIRSLSNNFFIIECINPLLKQEIPHGNVLFMRALAFIALIGTLILTQQPTTLRKKHM